MFSEHLIYKEKVLKTKKSSYSARSRIRMAVLNNIPDTRRYYG